MGLLVGWIGAAIVLSVLASRVTYGLRAEVHEARRVGQYTLEEKLGEGAMGIVYRARHARLKRPTAVKLLSPEKVGPHTVARFEREVQITARLTHPNTVAVFDYGRTLDGVFYYAMEYLEGISLEQLVSEDGPQPPGRVVHVLRQVAGALGEAHALGLVHRDIKPANVILCERGGMADVAKVLDFGLVKDWRCPRGWSHARRRHPRYAPLHGSRGPHGARARGAPHRPLCAGRGRLLPADRAARLHGCQHGRGVGPSTAHAPVRPSERLGAALPGPLEEVILACLAKEPEQRPRDARALQDALDSAGVEPWTEGTRAPGGRRRPLTGRGGSGGGLE